MKKKMGNREKTFLCITIPILILFFMFNTLPLMDSETMQTCFRMPEWEDLTCLLLNLPLSALL